MDERLKCKTYNCENPRRKHRGKASFGLGHVFMNMASKGNKSKNKQVGPHQMKKLPHTKETVNREKDNLLNRRKDLPTTFLIRN